jgi:hypothetical protein
MAKKKVTRKAPAKKKVAKLSATAAKTLAGKHMRARDKRKSYAALVKKYGRKAASRVIKMSNKMESDKKKAAAKKTSAKKTSAKKKSSTKKGQARKTARKAYEPKKSSTKKKKITSAGRKAQGKKLAARAKRQALIEFKKRKAALIRACKAHFKSARTRTVGGKKLTAYAQWVKKCGNVQLASMVYKACGMGK